MIKNSIKKLLIKESMYPSFISLFVNPFYFSRKNLLAHIINFSDKLQGDLLDVGCGNKPYQELFKVNSYTGLEFDSPENRNKKKADVYYNGNEFPFENERFDSIISTQVLEHISKQNLFLNELSRVLKLGGVCLITVPFIGEEHEKPFDFFRFTSFGISETLEKYGFEIKEYKKSTTGVSVLFQLLNDYIYKRINTRIGYLNILLIFILVSPSNIVGSILSLILPDDQDFFLDNVILIEKIRNI